MGTFACVGKTVLWPPEGAACVPMGGRCTVRCPDVGSLHGRLCRLPARLDLQLSHHDLFVSRGRFPLESASPASCGLSCVAWPWASPCPECAARLSQTAGHGSRLPLRSVPRSALRDREFDPCTFKATAERQARATAARRSSFCSAVTSRLSSAVLLCYLIVFLVICFDFFPLSFTHLS